MPVDHSPPQSTATPASWIITAWGWHWCFFLRSYRTGNGVLQVAIWLRFFTGSAARVVGAMRARKLATRRRRNIPRLRYGWPSITAMTCRRMRFSAIVTGYYEPKILAALGGTKAMTQEIFGELGRWIFVLH